jgi:membrane-associated protease RseP (regulator of RpoE activity)
VDVRVGNPVTNLLLFLATVVSVMIAGHEMMVGWGFTPQESATWWSGWPFALPFLLILACHEFGHWFAARIHRVPASLPYFLPVPMVLFGTMGAIITMPERIRSRAALLDIGAAGPLAGMVVAIPTMLIGLSLSQVGALGPEGYVQEGQSLLYLLLKRCMFGSIPAGHDVHLHPTAFAAWGGFLITMINLLPYGQLDGGHIAYALFGPKQNRYATFVRSSCLLLFGYNVYVFGVSSVLGNSLFWLLWWVITGVMARVSGAEHPPFEESELSPRRRLVAAFCLLLFLLLFMPTPIAQY